MDVIELLGDFLLAEDIKVIGAGIPEGQRIAIFHQTRAATGVALLRYALLQDLHDDGNASFVGFSDQQVDMLRHHHVADHRKFILLPGLFKDLQEQGRREEAPRKGFRW